MSVSVETLAHFLARLEEGHRLLFDGHVFTSARIAAPIGVSTDISQGKISVLTPIGAALIGMRAGHSITWETRAGDLKRLTVIDVREPKPV